jgi:hypothetical protein
MKAKWKNLLIALIIAAVITGIWASVIYYTVLKPMTDLSEEAPSISGIPPEIEQIEYQFYQGVLARIIGFLIVVFCITTILSYIIIERLRKRNK